ncbi:MAG TPA: hypothetical protein VH915_13940 [Pedococcus sp.]|jgi:hypothetical protein
MAAHHKVRMSEHVPGWNLSGNEPGASCDGDSGPQGAHLDPKPGNHPELTPQAPATPARPHA